MYISTSSFLVALDRMFQSKRYKNRLMRYFTDCKYFNFYFNFNFDRKIANKVNAQKAGRPPASVQIAPAAPALAPAAAPQNSPGGQGVQLEETAADEMAIDVQIGQLDDRTRGMQYIIILCNFRIKFFI